MLYGEDIFVGYRYYDTKKVPVRYAFGHGLSYTEFTYGDLTLSSAQMTDEDILTVSLKVKNSGKTEGKEVVQLYVADLCGETGQGIERICQSSSPAGRGENGVDGNFGEESILL